MFALTRQTVLAFGAASVLAIGGPALGADRSDHTRSTLSRGPDHGSAHRGGDDHRGGDRSRVSFGFGISDFGSGISFGIGSGFRGSYWPGYAPYRVGRPYYSPFYYGARYYSPVVRVYGDYPYAYSYPYSYSADPVYVSSPTVMQQPVVVQQQPVVVQQPIQQQFAPQQQMVASAAAPAQPQEAPGSYQDRELGDAYLRMGDADNAARAYKKYLTAWNGDGTAMRNLGFALVVRGDTQEGFRAVVQGYKLESSLVKRPIRMEDVGGLVGFQKLLDGAARGASGANTAEGWLTVAILQNTAGQRDAAINALQRSRDAGLEQGLMDQFAVQISTPTAPTPPTSPTPTR